VEEDGGEGGCAAAADRRHPPPLSALFSLLLLLILLAQLPDCHGYPRLDSLDPLRRKGGRSGAPVDSLQSPPLSAFPRRVSLQLTRLEPTQTYYGEPQQDGDLGLLYSNGERITARVVAAPWTSSPASTSSPRVLTVQTLLSPLAPTDVPAIRGMGLQYSADPANPQDKPPVACLFFKASQALAGPGDDIVLPRLARDEKNDYEVELCVVLGKDAKDVDEKDAMSFVGGSVSPPRPTLFP